MNQTFSLVTRHFSRNVTVSSFGNAQLNRNIYSAATSSSLLTTNFGVATPSSSVSHEGINFRDDAVIVSARMPTRSMSSLVGGNNHNNQKEAEMDFSTVATPNEVVEEQHPPGWDLIHTPPKGKGIRGALVGTVVSDKMTKTVNVAVDRYKIVPKYRKRLRFTRKFMAHDEEELCNIGDLVMIVPDRQRSKHKHFRVHEIIRAKGIL
mmetsp:Transcript_36544/g.53618  ORF Transcript_36544/g.53618 Transcript_36544/m.53618 type:complete len:207 (-) Transcript_36544:182-802(-)|eukprot:CAMPEP_0195519454 /NCGR_PEP_ID=MMETSP0794_2-20130614/14836_1 /TAXON_ID=515487 /ORGANISM="Stephanopyxis turris, Strain CCMP 815" /LENGTH=206 /DNA_ID=CAMNT_0040648611 /DNA_START=72 /DNA_END=692 /DNA_ORIENTATION=+